VTAFFLGWLHASIVFSKYFSLSFESAFASIFTFYGFTAVFVMLWLGLTSWDYVQKKFSKAWWNILHGSLLTLYSAIAFTVLYKLQAAKEPNLLFHIITITVFILFWLSAAPYSVVKRFMKTYLFGWKQLHVLIYIAYFSVVFHVAFGALEKQSIIVKSIFWIIVSLVLLSHLAGWIKRIYDDSKIISKINAVNRQFAEDQKTFIGIAGENDFVEGKGRKFYVSKKPIAVFKNENEFIAISDVCAHQKGPLHKGKVEYGIVECPWHYWTYQLKTGCTLGKERICVPKYEVKVKEGVVFVSSEPIQPN
jgi:nitrite reductase/ring-hydroxylating ferredoxin subunit/DMSO/TMAO reductase YedYZ heme-binding membrane subunit